MYRHQPRGLRPKQATSARLRCPLTGALLDDGGTLVVLETGGDSNKRHQVTFRVAHDADVTALLAAYPGYKEARHV